MNLSILVSALLLGLPAFYSLHRRIVEARA
jgi:hypothetical protein